MTIYVLKILFLSMIDIGTSEDFSFCSNTLLYRNVKGCEPFEIYPIKPSWSIIWDFRTLSIFLNQLTNFEPARTRATRKYKSLHDDYRTFKFVDYNSGYEVYLHISYNQNFLITVFVSRAMLLDQNIFTEMKEGNSFFTYYLRYKLSESSQSILNHETLVFFDISDFSSSFIYFAKLITRELVNNRFSCFLFEFQKFYIKRPNPVSIINLDSLTIKTKGYFKILTIDKQFPHLFKLNRNENFYVLHGCYISPFALSILENNEIIDGIMLDGTFKAIKYYVTCFIICIIRNTSIPLGFAFSHVEDEDLYTLVFKTFFETLQIDLSNFSIESDQGRCLINCCEKYNCTHIFCQRHLISNLQKLKFGFEASKIVSCKCQKDFQKLVDEFNLVFQKLDDKEIEYLNNTFERIGMKFNKKEITIINMDLWQKVSMLYRSTFRMPSTTNNIESIHGHVNEATPRNNCFYPSIYRLIMTVNMQIHRFNEKLHHNFNKIIRDIKKHKMHNPFIQNECGYYQTTLSECQCGETSLYSAMYRVDIPCSHRHFLGATFPTIQDIDLNITKQFNELILDVDNDDQKPKEIEIVTIKTLAMKNIKKHSHYKNKEEIQKYVDENFHPEYKEFALGYPIEFFIVISNGIEYFSNKLKQ